LAEQAAIDGVLIEPGDVFFAPESPPLNYFRLAYSSIPEARIDEGVSKLASAIETLRRSVG
jgi:GntR family transcriptional regulator/MocR family aminotransferase